MIGQQIAERLPEIVEASATALYRVARELTSENGKVAA